VRAGPGTSTARRRTRLKSLIHDGCIDCE